jgi:hypothetical protein
MERDTVEDAGDAEGPSVSSQHGAGATWSTVNAAVIGLFVALSVLGILLSMGLVESLVAIPTSESTPSTMTVPPYVYLYAGLGALGYVFTKLMVEFDRYDEWHDAEALASMLMRVPAALVLAAGVYLLLGGLGLPSGVAGGNVATGGGAATGGDGASGARFVAGVSFLVGLYVNVALKSLGSLADRVLGRSRGQGG